MAFRKCRISVAWVEEPALLGYAAFFLAAHRRRHAASTSNGPGATLREAGLLEVRAGGRTGPLSQRSPELSEFLEPELDDVEVLDRELDIEAEPPDKPAISALDAPHEPLGARFFSRARPTRWAASAPTSDAH